VLAITAANIDLQNPLSGLRIGERPEPSLREGWSNVTLCAASLNHHDLWALRGDGLRTEDLPRILGCDGAGIDENGNEVVIYPGINDPAWMGSEDKDPQLSLLSERQDGTFASKVSVPTRNLLLKPRDISFEEAACLPTAWLTAYRMLFTQAVAQPGSTVLIQGAGGGVATALILLAKAAGICVWVTSRSAEKRERALALGADASFEMGARLPEQVDAVMDTVGAATWRHSLSAVQQGGTVVVAGVTTGEDPPAQFGTTIGTRDELLRLLRFCSRHQIHPPIHASMPLGEGLEGFRMMLAGDNFGKIVFTM
jgi:NADPH:quinone reductase-like Zn-dependent oxidoreductase